MHDPDLGHLSHETDRLGNEDPGLGSLLWALLGLGFLLMAGILVVRSLPVGSQRRVDPPAGEQANFPGWEVQLSASLSDEGGEDALGRTVRLQALHSSPSRQAFDAAALENILGQVGEPWVLILPGPDSGSTWSIRLASGALLRPVPEGSHPVQRVLHATGTSRRRVLFGPKPLAPVLELDGALYPMLYSERPATDSEQPLLGEHL